MKIGFVGSRDTLFITEDVEESIRKISSLYPDRLTIVSGGAGGIDRMAENAAKKFGLNTQIFHADLGKGKSAGYIRNSDIVDNSDIVIAFWDGFSRGTEHSIGLCCKQNKPCILAFKSSVSHNITFTPVISSWSNRYPEFKHGSLFYVAGDMFNSGARYFVNPCNTVGVMGAGVSRQIASKYPAVERQYKQLCKENNLLHFAITSMTVLPPGPRNSASLRFIHLPTKIHWKDNSTTDLIESSLQHLRKQFDSDLAGKTIAMPMLGVGLGNLTIKEVEPLIVKYMSDAPYKTLLFLHPPDYKRLNEWGNDIWDIQKALI